MEWMIHNGKLTDDRVRLSARSRPVSYGDGCFATFRAYHGYFLALDKHLERLDNSINYLGISKPEELKHSSIKKQIHQLLEKNGVSDESVGVRIQVWREGTLGYNPGKHSRAGWIITLSELPRIQRSIALAQVPTRRIPSSALNSSFKLSNGINYIRASQEAEELGGDDALMLTVDDFVSETTIANIFWYHKKTIYTPNLECDILPGITRSILSHIIREKTDYKLVKGKFKVTDLKKSDGIWVCNSIREILPVHRVDEHTFQVESPMLHRLKRQFDSYKKQYLQPLKV